MNASVTPWFRVATICARIFLIPPSRVLRKAAKSLRRAAGARGGAPPASAAQAVARVPGTGRSELGQLGERRTDPYLARAEADDNRLVLRAQDPAEAILVVRYLIAGGELLYRLRIRRRHVEGTSGQGAPGYGTGSLHHYYYALSGRRRQHRPADRRSPRPLFPDSGPGLARFMWLTMRQRTGCPASTWLIAPSWWVNPRKQGSGLHKGVIHHVVSRTIRCQRAPASAVRSPAAIGTAQPWISRLGNVTGGC